MFSSKHTHALTVLCLMWSLETFVINCKRRLCQSVHAHTNQKQLTSEHHEAERTRKRRGLTVQCRTEEQHDPSSDITFSFLNPSARAIAHPCMTQGIIMYKTSSSKLPVRSEGLV